VGFFDLFFRAPIVCFSDNRAPAIEKYLRVLPCFLIHLVPILWSSLWHAAAGCRELDSRHPGAVLEMKSKTEPAELSLTLDKHAEFRL
jgi:hypothetical protein